MATSEGEGGRPSNRGPLIFISAGEPSGDLHGAGLARALRSRIPNVRLIGLGGDRMAAEGVELLATVDDLAVKGFAEVLSRLPFFLRLRRKVFDAVVREFRADRLTPTVDSVWPLHRGREAFARLSSGS